jgi:hypothetical protein
VCLSPNRFAHDTERHVANALADTQKAWAHSQKMSSFAAESVHQLWCSQSSTCCRDCLISCTSFRAPAFDDISISLCLLGKLLTCLSAHSPCHPFQECLTRRSKSQMPGESPSNAVCIPTWIFSLHDRHKTSSWLSRELPAATCCSAAVGSHPLPQPHASAVAPLSRGSTAPSILCFDLSGLACCACFCRQCPKTSSERGLPAVLIYGAYQRSVLQQTAQSPTVVTGGHLIPSYLLACSNGAVL